jgi:iron complex outermembrane receptor protein
MNQIQVVALVSASILGLSAPALAQDLVGPPSDAAGASQDVVPGGEPEAAYEANTAVIVVEARRRNESAQDVPLVVNAVTAETITELNLRDFKDIQTVVPGLQMTSNANGIGTTSSVRGVSFDVNASGNAGTIEYYLNDAPITSGALFNAMYDIGQIEVLRGPQGTLRGRASPSGSITVAHRKPDLDEIGGYVLGTVNDIGGANVNAAVGAPILPGILAVRVAGLVERGRGSRVRSINSELDPFTRTKSGRVFIRAEPTEWLNAEGVYQRIELESRQYDQVACANLFGITTGAAGTCPVSVEPEDRLSTSPGGRRTEQIFDVFTWRASAAFAGQRLYYVGSYTKQDVDTYDSFAPASNGASGSIVNFFPGVDYGQFTSNLSKITSHELRFQNDERLAGLFDYAVGYFQSKLNADSFIYTQTPRGLPAIAAPGTFRTFINSGTFRPIDTEEKSFFGNLTLHLGERTEVSVGTRRIKYDTDSSLLLPIPTPPGAFNGLVDPFVVPSPGAIEVGDIVALNELAAPANLPRVVRSFRHTIYSASAKHRFSGGFMVYANFGTSWRPGLNVTRSAVNAQNTPLETRFIVLDPETSKSYEVGFKSNWLNNTVTLNVAAFRQDFKNYPYRSQSGIPYLNYTSAAQARSAGSLATFNYVAPADVRVNGAEAELTWKPSNRINLSANLAYALGKIRDSVVPCADIDGDGVPDLDPPTSAAQLLASLPLGQNLATCQVNFRSSTSSPWNGNVQGEYSLPLSGAADGFVRGLVTFTGNTRNDPANRFDDYDAYALVNLYAGLRDPGGAWEVTLYGKNIFEQETVLATSNGALATSYRNDLSPGTVITVNSPYIGLGSASIPGLTAPREFGVTARFAFGSR